jgi:hypothetical protein
MVYAAAPLVIPIVSREEAITLLMSFIALSPLVAQ